MKTTLFKEEQKYQGKDLIVLTSIIILLLSYHLLQDLFVRHEQSLLANSVCLLAIIALTYWIKSLFERRQKNTVTAKKLICRVNSWYKRKRKIKLDNIASCAIVETPINAQWHGGNIGLPREEVWAINGRNGLAIETKDGKKIFIGSLKAKEMAKAIHTGLEH